MSAIGVPVFMADVKGDLSGIAGLERGQPKNHGALAAKLSIKGFHYTGYPTVFWDLYGDRHRPFPVRTTISRYGTVADVAVTPISMKLKAGCLLGFQDRS